MLCKKPFMGGVVPFGCGQCLPCRINKRRLWAHRLVLESFKHGDSCFVTLTYDEDHYPEGGSLVPKHTQDWLKRLRRAWPAKIRYFLVGEYGDNTQRAHYHAAVFGIGPAGHEIIGRTWGKGFVYVGDLTAHSAQYIVGYVTKKMTKKDDSRLNGRHPEFARMSLRPGIGASAMEELGDVVTSEYGCNNLIRTGDVPLSLRHGRANLPLGRYLRRKLRERVGFKEVGAQEGWALRASEELCAVQEAYEHDPKNASKPYYRFKYETDKQKIINIENKAKLKNGGLL